MIPPILLQTAAFFAAVVIFWRSEPVLNLMGPSCHLSTRLAFWALAVGAAALIVLVCQGYTPTLPVVLSLGGTAMLLEKSRQNLWRFLACP
jgi:hypothetical protein